MADKKIIAVVGATGAQGGGLVQAILNDPDGGFAVRAITRDPNSEKAQALAAQGTEVVQADLKDVESLKRAFAGAYGAYLVTFFWDPDVQSGVKEKHQAQALATAARGAGLQHIIWSTLEDTRYFLKVGDTSMPWLEGGRFIVPHFDGKAESDMYFAGLPVTYLRTSFYWDNFTTWFAPLKGDDGAYILSLPMGEAPLAGMAAEDIGKCAYGIFKEADKDTFGTYVGVVGESLTLQDICAKLSEGLGVEVRYNAIEPSVFAGYGFPGAEDLANMFQAYRDYADGFEDNRDWFQSERFSPDLQDFDDWLAKNKATVAAAMKLPAPEPATPEDEAAS